MWATQGSHRANQKLGEEVRGQARPGQESPVPILGLDSKVRVGTSRPRNLQSN